MSDRRRGPAMATVRQIADAINLNAMTEAEATGDRDISLTVRPKNSSRTFVVHARILDVKEV